MNINQITPISLKANANRRLVPLKEFKGPKLDLMFYEKDEIKLLNEQILQLELEARDVIRTTSINNHLTGYQKNKCQHKLFSIEDTIRELKDKIYRIKKSRYSKQMEEFLKKVK